MPMQYQRLHEISNCNATPNVFETSSGRSQMIPSAMPSSDWFFSTTLSRNDTSLKTHEQSRQNPCVGTPYSVPKAHPSWTTSNSIIGAQEGHNNDSEIEERMKRQYNPRGSLTSTSAAHFAPSRLDNLAPAAATGAFFRRSVARGIPLGNLVPESEWGTFRRSRDDALKESTSLTKPRKVWGQKLATPAAVNRGLSVTPKPTRWGQPHSTGPKGWMHHDPRGAEWHKTQPQRRNLF
jgi:hypothetical protein